MTDLEPGEVVGERFRIEHILGKGGMGAVLAATDLESGRKVALKVMRSAFAGDSHLLERFRREAEVLAKIDHPAVVGVMDAGALPDGNYFIALERLDGETLKHFLAREGRMPLPLLIPVINGLAGALSAAHAQGVVHRDVKPSNVFLPSQPEQSLSLEGAQSLVKLVDFGVAKVAGARKLTMIGGAVGTFQYMAPEQLRGESDVDGRADVYSVGILAYEALTGVLPFKKPEGVNHMDIVACIMNGEYPRLRSVRPELPAQIEVVIARAMHHDRRLRYQQAEDFAHDLAETAREFLVRETTPAPPSARAELLSSRPTVPAKVRAFREEHEAPAPSGVRL
jgi:serine/threonine-protein kinase